MSISQCKSLPICFTAIFCATLSLLIGLSSCTEKHKAHTQLLNESWLLYNPLSGETIPTGVPGSVHTDLLAAGKIPDPFFGTAENDLQWISNQDWLYTLTFKPDFQPADFQRKLLVFDGLDTYADVWLNDSLILRADNMFRRWRIDISDLLLGNNNKLTIRFYAPDSINRIKAAKLPFSLPEERAFSRKAPYQFGWDWGPEYITMGIWKAVRLEAWNHIRLENFTIHQHEVDENMAELELEVEIESIQAEKVDVRLQIGDLPVFNFAVDLKAGKQTLVFPLRIAHPQRWWPNGMGGQYLYDLTLTLQHNNAVIARESRKLGLRKIELVREADSTGESFYFRVNGKPMYAKGANYIPADHFVHRQTSQKTRQLLVDAKEVHMNMIRVWGGGVYPDDVFYELCDSLGLLVWQDFMFACTMYPFDDEFLANVKQEAVDQVKRLRKHTSLALWCGNNEVDEGFHNWGWQKSLAWSDADSAAIWQGYLALFEKLLPEVIQQSDLERNYWPSSPSTGWGRPESLLQGDVHYWGVWWGEEPFEKYREKVGRFNSEFGFQAMSAMASIKRFIPTKELHIGSAGLEAHQKHPRGTNLIHDYMQRDFPVPNQLDEYVYMSQLVQAHGIGMAIEAQRRSRPHSMGSLYWQLNDTWPVTSWSSVDYYGAWKALHYQLKESFNNILLSIADDREGFRLWITSDSLVAFAGELQVNLLHPNGQLLARHTLKLDVAPGSSFQVMQLDSIISAAGAKPESCCVQAMMVADGKVLANRLLWLAVPIRLQLLPAGLQVSLSQQGGETWVKITADNIARQVALSTEVEGVAFGDNFFDLLPGQEKHILVTLPDGVKLEPAQLKLTAMNDFVDGPN